MKRIQFIGYPNHYRYSWIPYTILAGSFKEYYELISLSTKQKNV